ncbi:MAG: hypothetical protein KGH65_00635 [Candidatus Micrarchaeota archaeon]|nr:hypothetical protein [Candidatus Micrarchaeota archaeon]
MALFREKPASQRKDVHILELCETADIDRIYGALKEALREGGAKGAFRDGAQINQLLNSKGMVAIWHILENAPNYAEELAAMRKGYEERGKVVPESAQAAFIAKYSNPDHLVAIVEVGESSIRVRTYGLEKGMVLSALLRERLIGEGLCSPEQNM